VEGHESDFRSITNEQEHESEREHGGFEVALDEIEFRPQQRAAAGAEQLLGREVQQDSPEQRLRDTDAAQDEIFPRCFEARGCPVERHEQHGRERRRLERNPQNPKVVGQKRQQHREVEELVHRMVEP
jgi:hypothetical protein